MVRLSTACTAGTEAVDPVKFERVELRHRETVQAFTSRYGRGSCQQSFVTWFTLQEKYGDEIAREGDALFVRRSRLCTETEDVCLMPLGPGDAREQVGMLLDECHSRGRKLVLFTVTEEDAADISAAFPGTFQIAENRDYAEYLFETDRLIGMSGPELAKKRNNLGRFHRAYEGMVETVPLTADCMGEAKAYSDAWFAANIESHDRESMLREQRCMALQFAHFDTLGLRGFLLRINGTARGLCYGVPLSEQVFDGLIMKADRDVIQINVFMYAEIARICGCPVLDAEEDLGVPGLRESKLGFKPARLLKKYVVREV